MLRSSRWLSLPLRERGLKYGKPFRLRQQHIVAPFVGVWIEITSWLMLPFKLTDRFLHGSADRNTNTVYMPTHIIVAPCIGARIEITSKL